MISSLQQKSQVDREEAGYALRQLRQKFILETQSESLIKMTIFTLRYCVEFEQKLSDIERKHRIGSEQLNILLQYKVCHIVYIVIIYCFRSLIANNVMF